ncbi:MAG: DUF3796 domain-containing protein [Candidatus Bathyarchaeota archaeon]|nr:DUF3796 domain-containing protein [Candidatus Termiticorpusculum sp.]
MKKNKLSYLGLLGLTGLLGLYNPLLFSLFTLFTLFIFIEADERIEKNVGLASRNAFLFYSIFSTILLAYFIVTKTYDALPILFVTLCQGVTIFSVSYAYYNRRGE